MSSEYIISLVIYLISFGISLYALNALDYTKFIRKGKIIESQVLYIVLSLVVAYLLGNFILVILN